MAHSCYDLAWQCQIERFAKMKKKTLPIYNDIWSPKQGSVLRPFRLVGCEQSCNDTQVNSSVRGSNRNNNRMLVSKISFDHQARE